jgi:hypothetical protein
MLQPAYIDVTKDAGQVSVGFSRLSVRVLVGHKLWDLCVGWSKVDNQLQTHQDIDGRLFDILFTCGIAINSNFEKLNEEYRIYFGCNVTPRDGKAKRPVEKLLTATLTSGDDQLFLVIDLA